MRTRLAFAARAQRATMLFLLHFQGVSDDKIHLCLTLKPVWDGSFHTNDSKSQNDTHCF